MPESCLVTGANGFVGAALSASLSRAGWQVREAVRRTRHAGDWVVGEIDGRTDWSSALAGVQVVVHAAARVHVMRERVADPLAEFRRVNRDGSLNLARQAHEAGVRRLVFISSIKVNGEATLPGRPFSAGDPAAPQDPYGVSKWEAEQALREFCADKLLELVIVRPTLVYGPGVVANFSALMRLVRWGLPLPLAAVHNRRSLVALDNLVSLLICCMQHSGAAGQTFLVRDQEDLSTAQLIRHLARAMGRPERLFAMPPALLRGVCTVLGAGAIHRRLCSSLQVDDSDTRRRLDWMPPLDTPAAMLRVVQVRSEQGR